MKKNDTFILKIEDMGIGGEGIGKYEGMTFFVKDAVIGDEILAGVTKLKKGYGYARLVEIVKPSPKRVEAPCKIARQCGGCQIQNLCYEEQLVLKQKKVENNLRRIGQWSGWRIRSAIAIRRSFLVDMIRTAISSLDFMRQGAIRSSRSMTACWGSVRMQRS